jgi:hypothetical protein
MAAQPVFRQALLACEVVRSEGEPEDQQDYREQEDDDPEDRDERGLSAFAFPFNLMQMVGFGFDLSDGASQPAERLPIEGAGMSCGVPSRGHCISVTGSTSRAAGSRSG